jgi:subtilisin family serine protease
MTFSGSPYQPKPHANISEVTMQKLSVRILVLALATALPLSAAERFPVPDVSRLSLPRDFRAVVDSRLFKARGEVEVVVRLGDSPLAGAQGEGAKKRGAWLAPSEQRRHLAGLTQKQEDVTRAVRSLGGRETARISKALNAVIVKVDAAQLPAIAALPGVVAIRPVVNYRLALAETVSYVGALAAQTAGFDGSGVRVAVLDSGIDYTHKEFGGPGTQEAYAAAYGADAQDPKNTTTDGLFPTAKVVGGYDFVGESWPDGDLMPDPDPIDSAGHGTHVADIIGGKSGVAPGVTLYALKVCSSTSSSCSGVALLQAMDFALDPDGDGDLSDAVDVINLSLGTDYGQQEDDLSLAVANAVRLGVVVVAAAGNSGDRPYIVSSPSTTPGVISVAETHEPADKRFPLTVNSPAAIAGQIRNTESVAWAPVVNGFTGDVVFVGRGCPADATAPGSPEDPYLADPAGKVALIDRGGCNVSLKVDRAARAGALGVLIAMVTDADPISFAAGGGDTFVETLVIAKLDADRIRGQLSAGATVSVTASPTSFIPLVGSVVVSSARGPSYSFNAIKPDIAAPGASVSAEVGTGEGMTPFGGTSGATPVIAGAAALLVQAHPDLAPLEIQSLLVDTADTEIQSDPARFPGVPAPITRIGGGEVRVDRALQSRTAMWAEKERVAGLSFGYEAAAKNQTYRKEVAVRNYADSKRTYSISPEFRYADDAAGGAVQVQTPRTLTVAAHGTGSFEVTLTVDASRLPVWNLNGGGQGGNGPLLQGVEFDGYVRLTDGVDQIHLPWQILPHRAAAVDTGPNTVRVRHKGSGMVLLNNTGGAVDGRVDTFSLTGTSPQIPRGQLAGPGDNFAVIDLKYVGARLVRTGTDEFGIQFAVNTFGERAHPNYPAEFDVFIDTDLDGTFDYVVFNSESGGFAMTGQNVVNVYDFASQKATAYFFTDADLDSANVILTAPLTALGITPDTQIRFSVVGTDNYFTGNPTDSIEEMIFTAGQPRFVWSDLPESGVPAGGVSRLQVAPSAGGEKASPSQSGLLLMYRDAQPGREADAIRVLEVGPGKK